MENPQILYEKAMIDAAKIDGFVKEYGGKMRFIVDPAPCFLYSKPRKGGRDNEDVLFLVREILESMKKLL